MSRLATAAAAALLAAGLGLAACSGEEAAPTSAADKSAPASPADGAPPAMPSAPSPLPALNEFADRCARGGAPSEEPNAAGRHAALCAEGLLETLRAAVGAAGLSAESAGGVLESAETAVRRLAAGSRDADAGALAREAALGMTDLAALVDADVGAMRAAAEAIDPSLPLTEQAAALDAYFAAADAAVRPRVLAGGGAARGPGV